MKGTLRLGRVEGIEIDAHWSLLAIAALILVSLAVEVLPDLDPGHGPVAYWSVGVVVVALFYASLVAHELSHSLVARRRGVEVRRITLWLLGGMSQLESDSRSAADELAIAVAGPIMSVASSAAFLVLAALASTTSAWTLLTAALVWLAFINLVLALFNLLPAFPLDGGRVLRAALWRSRGDEVDATQTAARVSTFVAYGLVAVGIILFLLGAGISGIWFALLGWFVVSAARGETDALLAREALTGVRVSDLMTPHPVAVHSHLSVGELIDHYVLGDQHSSYPVLDANQHPVGLVTLDAIRRVPAAHRRSARVDDVMFPMSEVPALAPGDAMQDVVGNVLSAATGRALVLDDGRLVGILSLSDVARALERRSLAA